MPQSFWVSKMIKARRHILMSLKIYARDLLCLENQENPMFKLSVGKLQLLLLHQVQQNNKSWHQCQNHSMFQEKSLHKNTKFMAQVNENDESYFWALITKQPYQDKIIARMGAFVVEFWESHSPAIPDINHVV